VSSLNVVLNNLIIGVFAISISALTAQFGIEMAFLLCYIDGLYVITDLNRSGLWMAKPSASKPPNEFPNKWIGCLVIVFLTAMKSLRSVGIWVIYVLTLTFPFAFAF